MLKIHSELQALSEAHTSTLVTESDISTSVQDQTGDCQIVIRPADDEDIMQDGIEGYSSVWINNSDLASNREIAGG